MDTREHLREQRWTSGRAGTLLGVGFLLGLSLGLVMLKGGAANTELGWAFYLITYGLGIISVLATWWVLGYEITQTKKQGG